MGRTHGAQLWIRGWPEVYRQVGGSAASGMPQACFAVGGALDYTAPGAWSDLDRWSRPIGGGQTERGLGLHLPGPSGSVMMAFVIHSTCCTTAAGDITVQVSTGPLSNDLSSRLTVDSPARALRALVNPT